MGDKEVLPKFEIKGLLLIVLGVACDAVTANFEERRFFKEIGSSHREVLLYSSLFASGWALITLILSGELDYALPHSFEYPMVYVYGIVSAFMGYASVSFVLLLIQNFGATITEVVKSCRKVASIVISFILVAKPVSKNHLVGGFLFSTAVCIGVLLKYKSSKKKKLSNEV
eukprot:m.94674 g.94674  ORF g.94674 m.94674 type:complete len:171 (-) comp13456_c0_seq2:8-520(-)